MNNRLRKLMFVLLLAFLTSCTSYIWSPVTTEKHKEALNNFVGQDFSNYPGSESDARIINETEDYKEYEYSVYKDNQGTKCSWVLKVNKKSNVIENWRYTSANCE